MVGKQKRAMESCRSKTLLALNFTWGDEGVETVIINLKELSDNSGKTEVELAMTILSVLALKAEVTGEEQHIKLHCKETK